MTNYLAILNNVNSTIKSLNFGDGLSVQAWPKNDLIEFIANAQSLPSKEVDYRFEENYGIDEKDTECFVISGNFDIAPFEYVNCDSEENINKAMDIHKIYDKIENNIGNKIRLLRLVKQGNVKIPYSTFYIIDENGKHESVYSNEDLLPNNSQLYVVAENEVDIINKFINKSIIPLKPKYLQLAFENFNLSYSILENQLAFLVLMICLETIFNSSKQELRYRISRNIAVLLGTDRLHSEIIFKEIRNFYDKRSKLVHTGNSDDITYEDTETLREYVRKSIKTVYKLRLSKDELSIELNKYGFGDFTINQI
jgi:hypothetical protein